MDAERLARLGELLDRQDILDCLTRFSRGLDRLDRALFLSAWHADAVCAAGPFVGDPVALWDWSSALHEAAQVATHHNLLNHACELDGNTAHAETYYLFAARNRDGSISLAQGRYVDRLERRGTAWRLALRTNLIEWAGELPPMPVPFADVPGVHDNGAPARSPADPSYQRPLANVRAPQLPGG